MENNEFKKFRIKYRTCSYFNDIIKVEDCELEDCDPKHFSTRFDKIDGFIRIYDGTIYLSYLNSYI